MCGDLSAADGGVPRRMAFQNTNGGTCCGDDHGLHRSFQLGFSAQPGKKPLSTNLVMVATVVVAVATHNLAYGVLVGVLLASLFLRTRLDITSTSKAPFQESKSHRTYHVVARCTLALRTSSLNFLTSRKLSTKSPSISHTRIFGISPPSQRWIRS